MVPMAPVSRVRTGPAGEVLISESTVTPARGTSGYSPSARQSLLWGGDKITQRAPVLGEGCQSNSSLELAPRLQTAWEGTNGNKSPAGTVGIFSSIICVDESNLESSGSQIQGSDGVLKWNSPSQELREITPKLIPDLLYHLPLCASSEKQINP